MAGEQHSEKTSTLTLNRETSDQRRRLQTREEIEAPNMGKLTRSSAGEIGTCYNLCFTDDETKPGGR